MELNTQQKKAINLTKGPCVVLAGAGTGKTYTIRQKIKHLIENNFYKPKEILCLTFSNEATNNLRQKVSEDINELSNDLTIKTFHSFCYEIIKENTDFFKIKEDSQIISPDDFKVFLHKYFNIDAYYSNRYVNTIQNCKDFGITIEQIKQYIQDKILVNLIDIEHIEKLKEIYKNKQKRLSTLYLELNNADKDYKKELKQEKKEIKEFIENYQKYIKFNKFIETWEKYEEFKKEKGYLDYGDLNKFVLDYFKEIGSEKYVDEYKYVFVDEFQDTNKLQFELIKYIAKHKNITVVGDLNQSIYGFRGAYKESFEEFKKFFNVLEEDICKLDISYRSTNKILNTSYDLIKNNYENIQDCVKIHSFKEKEGNQVKCINFNNQYEEARFITDDILEKKENISLDNICVLVRTHKQAEVIKQALELKKIPYVYAGKKNLLDAPEIQTVVSYLSVLSNLIERKAIGDISWWNLFHYSNLLSAKDSYKIGKFLKDNRFKEITINDILLETNKEDLGLSLEGKKIIQRILQRFDKILKISNKKIPQIVLDIYDICGINRKFTYVRNLENTEHLYNLKKFYEISESFYKMHSKRIVDFVEYLEIINKLNITVDAEKINNKNAVRLMTIHASKGLEFNTVYVTNLAKDRFPVTRTKNDPLIPKELLEDRRLKIEDIKKENTSLDEKELEKLVEKEIKNYEKEIFIYEERRLFYVAITRAEENLYFTYAKSYNDSDKEYTKSVFL
ncbi:MAG: ATP-dependent helicase, partial [Candidatus ainarchaeum sp.]|nr:ATP-dependent helicase [Candidatus ainarchaeum sp.]